MEKTKPRIYILRNPDIPWGDYGHILHCGMTSHLGRYEGLLQLERTGPFVPPISLSGIGNIVVTDEFKHTFEKSGLTGIVFRPVIKKHIVRLEWEKWDKKAEEPFEIPNSGGPEDYILENKHSEEVANQIGDLWEVCLEEAAVVEKEQVGRLSWEVEIYLIASSLPGKDFFRAKSAGYVYLSENAKSWLEQMFPAWVSFQQAKVRYDKNVG